MSIPNATSDSSAFLAAFPALLHSDVVRVATTLPAAEFPPARPFALQTCGEHLTIPYRIYNPEPGSAVLQRLSAQQELILHCIYSRHHDGWVRQRHLESVVASHESWVVPFVVSLVGEYVIQILEVIRQTLIDESAENSSRKLQYGRFALENPEFLRLTAARAMSYWGCYYRGRYLRRRQRPNWEDYPGIEIVKWIRDARAEFESSR